MSMPRPPPSPTPSSVSSVASYIASPSPRSRARMAKRKDMAARRAVMMPGLDDFYETEKNFKRLCRHVAPAVSEAGTSAKKKDLPISCRVFEHLCTRYITQLDGPAVYRYKGRIVNLNEEYMGALASNSKALFDCFRRGPKIEFTKHGRTITTTVGQLYWFKWAMENGVLNYAYRIRNELEEHAAMEKRARAADRVAEKRAADEDVPGLGLMQRPTNKPKRRRREKVEVGAFTMANAHFSVSYA